MERTVRTVCEILGLSLLACFGGDTPRAGLRHAVNAPPATNAIATTSVNRAIVQFADDRMTIDAADIALGRILEELARKRGFTLACHDALTDRVTLRVNRLPFDEALAILLRGRSYTLHYVRSPDVHSKGSQDVASNAGTKGVEPTVRIAALYVYSARGAHSGAEQADVGSETVERLGVDALTDTDASVRFQAVDALAEMHDEHQIGILQRALTDPEGDVREAAIDALGYIGGDEAASALEIALHDESEMLREEAAAALGNIGGPVAVALLERAVDDGNRAAPGILAALSESAR